MSKKKLERYDTAQQNNTQQWRKGMMSLKRTGLVTLMLMLSCVGISVQAESADPERNLRVGAARVDITPPADPENPPPGKYDHEKMNVRAIVLDNGESRAALVTADLADITEALWEAAAPQIAQELNCPIEQIIMSSIHSHSACPPKAADTFFKFDLELVTKAIVTAVQQAKQKLQPAQVGFGTGQLYLNVNRDVIDKKSRLWTQAANLEGPSDKTLAVVLFTDMEGKPIAGYMNYAMHAVNGYLVGITSADFPGAASRYVEKAFGDDMVMAFTQGASGDQNPLWLRPGTNAMASRTGVEITGYEMVREEIEAPLRAGAVPIKKVDPEAAETMERYMDALGVIMGEEAIRIMSNIESFDSDVRIWGAQEVISLPGRNRLDKVREGQPGVYEDGSPVDIRLGMLGIGNIALSTIDAEIYSRFAQLLKEASPMTNTVFVTISNGRGKTGYIIPDSDYGKYTFQTLGNKLQPGHAEQEIVGALVKQIESYLDN